MARAFLQQCDCFCFPEWLGCACCQVGRVGGDEPDELPALLFTQVGMRCVPGRIEELERGHTQVCWILNRQVEIGSAARQHRHAFSSCEK